MTYQCVRIYRFRPGSLDRVSRSVRFELVPAFARQPGFRRYRFVASADDRAVSESLWETSPQAVSADVIEGDWVRALVSTDLADLPDVVIGEVEVDAEAPD